MSEPKELAKRGSVERFVHALILTGLAVLWIIGTDSWPRFAFDLRGAGNADAAADLFALGSISSAPPIVALTSAYFVRRSGRRVHWHAVTLASLLISDGMLFVLSLGYNF